MDRILGIDFGDVRIGVAVSDPLGITAQALPYLRNGSDTVQRILALIQDYDVQSIAVGLPQRRGEDTLQTQKVRDFARVLQSKTEVPIQFVDEGFTTLAVQKKLIGANVSRAKRKEKVDSLSAALLVQRILDQNVIKSAV